MSTAFSQPAGFPHIDPESGAKPSHPTDTQMLCRFVAGVHWLAICRLGRAACEHRAENAHSYRSTNQLLFNNGDMCRYPKTAQIIPCSCNIRFSLLSEGLHTESSLGTCTHTLVCFLARIFAMESTQQWMNHIDRQAQRA